MENGPGFKEMAAQIPAAKQAVHRASCLDFLRIAPASERFLQY
jgi:hypothetical protein